MPHTTNPTAGATVSVHTFEGFDLDVQIVKVWDLNGGGFLIEGEIVGGPQSGPHRVGDSVVFEWTVHPMTRKFHGCI